MFAFCSRFDAKYRWCFRGCLFVWSVIVQTKKQPRIHALIFCIRIWFWFGNCWFVFGRCIRFLFFCYLNWRRQRNFRRFWFCFSLFCQAFGFVCFVCFVFFLWVCFWENDAQILLFCLLVYDHPNEKNSRIDGIIFPQMNSILKMFAFCSRFDVKCQLPSAVFLFGLWSSKRKNSRDWRPLFCIQLTLIWRLFVRVGNLRCINLTTNVRCLLFLFLFLSFLSLSFFFGGKWLQRFGLFCRLVYVHSNEKTAERRFHLFKRKIPRLMKMFAFCSRFDVKYP